MKTAEIQCVILDIRKNLHQNNDFKIKMGKIQTESDIVRYNPPLSNFQVLV